MKILFALSTFLAPLSVAQGALVVYPPCEGVACEYDFIESCERLLTENDYAEDSGCCSLSTLESGCRLTITNGTCNWNARPVSIMRHDGSDTPFVFDSVLNTEYTASSDLATECPASEFNAVGRPKAKEGTVQGLIMTLRGVEKLSAEQLDFQWAPAYVEHANNNNLDLDTVNSVEPYFALSNFPGTVAVYFAHKMSFRSVTAVDVNARIDNLFSSAEKQKAFLKILFREGVLFEATRSIVFPTLQQGDLSGEFTLAGISSLTEDEIDELQITIQDYVEAYYIFEQTNPTVTSVSATVQVTNREEVTGDSSRRRKLQGSVAITYDMLISFRTTDDEATPLEVAAKPFIETIEALEASIKNGAGSLGQVTSISANGISIPPSPFSPAPTSMPTSMPTPEDQNRSIEDSAMSLGAKTFTLASLLLISLGYDFL